MGSAYSKIGADIPVKSLSKGKAFMSDPTVFLIAVVAIIGVGYIYYKRKSKVLNIGVGPMNLGINYDIGEDHVEIEITPSVPNNKKPNIIRKKIKLSHADKDVLETMTSEDFRQKCQMYSCPLTGRVFQDPVAMNCCLGDKLGEKQKVQQWFQKQTTCPLCKKKGKTFQSIIMDNQHIKATRDGVLTLRKRLQVTYSKLSPQLLEQFQRTISEYFDENYVEQHLVKPRIIYQLITKCKMYSCPITHKVLKDPVGMNCCSGKKLAESAKVISKLQIAATCPMCKKKEQSVENIIYQNEQIIALRQSVKMFKKEIQINYKKLTGQQLKQFKQVIYQYFGKDYILRNLMQAQ